MVLQSFVLHETTCLYNPNLENFIRIHDNNKGSKKKKRKDYTGGGHSKLYYATMSESTFDVV